MIDNTTRDLIKKMFNDIMFNDDERTGNNNDIKIILEKNEKYQELLKKKKEIDDELKELKEEIALIQIEQNDKIKESIKMIKVDLCKNLDCKVKIVNQVYKFFKIKYKGEDQLQEITDKFVEIFDINDEE
jgi:microcompartment protein CcmL/EutN